MPHLTRNNIAEIFKQFVDSEGYSVTLAPPDSEGRRTGTLTLNKTAIRTHDGGEDVTNRIWRSQECSPEAKLFLSAVLLIHGIRYVRHLQLSHSEGDTLTFSFLTTAVQF